MFNKLTLLSGLFKDYLRLEVDTKDYNCTVSTVDSTLRADCRGKTKGEQVRGLPKNLDANIQYLDLSNNYIEDLKNESFERYKNLIWLSLAGSSLPFDVPFQLLEPLEKLDFLNVSSVGWVDNPVWAWPRNVRIVDAFNFRLEELDISVTKNLEILNVSNNQLANIPVMNQLAPLKLVKIDNNPLHSLTAEHLAHYCNLHNLSISVSKNSELLKPAKLCQCVRLDAWIKTYDIQLSQKLNCLPPIDGGAKCDTTFSSETLAVRKECLDKYKSSLLKLLAIIMSVIFIVFLIVAFIAYKYGVLKKKVASGEVEYVEDLKEDSKSKSDSKLSGPEEEGGEEEEE